ncbi:MAG TPA: metallophosphoesterase [Dongiaceae bacterium]|nr:metallophosphoesterase [Dongiaceae bacterium]HVO82535.1 metallophosphoesterase [Terriglobales bacterium]
MRRRQRFAVFIAIVQFILLLAHLFLYDTWTFRHVSSHRAWLQAGLGVLSISFVAASILAFSYTSASVRAFYKTAAAWMGFLSFLFLAGLVAWLVLAVTTLAGVAINFHLFVEVLFAIGIAFGLCGIWNANWTRITRIRVKLEKLPDAWRGRKAALISDVHLGHVRNRNFLQRLIAKVLNEEPDLIFIAGDLFDGTAIDAHRAAEPLSQLTAPHGVYFVAGNHEQFGDDSKYLNAIAATGVRVLKNERVNVDGLQIVGVPYRDAATNGGLKSALWRVPLDRERASILLTHAPGDPATAEALGFSLQLSGHTHLGQFIPWSWMARRIYRQFVYGLSRIGKMQVFTSSGAGTWGPPLRLGSNPEIVMLEFE